MAATPDAPETPDDSTDTELNGDDEAGQQIEPLDIKDSKLDFLREWRQTAKRKKLARRGYVQWYLIEGGVWPSPRFIKPKPHGNGMPEYEHGDKIYFFPPGSAVPSSKHGIRTVVHHVDDAKPINLEEPGKPAIDPSAVKHYLTMGTVTGPPGWLSGLNWDRETMLRGLLSLIIGGTILYGVLSGGLV